MDTRTAKVGREEALTKAREDDQDEKRLVERAKAGDRRALGELLLHNGPKLFRCVLLPRLGSEARARDALSATYEKAIERLHLYEWQPCGMYPWLRVVALRIALDMIRATRRELLFQNEDILREIEQAEAALHSEHGSDRFDLVREHDDLDHARKLLHEALNQIHPRYAEAIRLRVLQERSREEVAELLGVSTATFDVLLHRSMVSLKKALTAMASDRQES